MFELMQLRCFIAVAEELHFGRAAVRLNMTQPPLSRQIQVLERILHAELFHRSSRAVSLTAAGTAFLAEARRVVQLADGAAARARSAAEGRQGSLTLGFTAASGYQFVPQVVAAAREAMPGVQLVLKELVSGDQIEGILSGRIDVGLLRPPVRRPEFETRILLRERFLVCAPQKDAADLLPTRLAEFDGLPFIMYAPDIARYFHDLLTGLFASVCAVPRNVQYLGQIHSILALVGAGMGYALVPAAAASLHPEGVVFGELEDEGARVELYAAWLRGNSNPALPHFTKMIEATCDPVAN